MLGVGAQPQVKVEAPRKRVEYELEVVVPHRIARLAGAFLKGAMPPVAVFTEEELDEFARKVGRQKRGLLSALRATGLVMTLRTNGKKHYIFLKNLDLDKFKLVLGKKTKSLNPLSRRVVEYSQRELQELARERGVSVKALLWEFKKDYLVVRLKYPREIRYLLFKGVNLPDALKALEEFTRVLNGQPPEEVKN